MEAAKKERELYIHGLKKVITDIEKVLNQNDSVQIYNRMAANSDDPEYVITETESETLKKIKRAAEQKVLQLEANQFIVAVVGVSGSGKSAATNAIVVGKNLLPVSNTECTLAETEIHYAPESKAVVTFYTEEEFHGKFIATLKGLIGFPAKLINDAETIKDNSGYRGFGLGFKQWLDENEMNSSLVGVKELQNIIQNIDTIWKKIGREELKLGDVTKAALKPYIADKKTSPAVKKIVIYSPILEGMQNAIFKDMPGIGTTTKSFSSMSARAILDADAVLLVKKFDEPVDTEAFTKLFTEVRLNLQSEDEKRRFTEKIFLFLNQADRANVAQLKDTPGEHLKILMESLNRMDNDFRNILEDHMVIGSAMAFAPDAELEENIDVKINAHEALIEKGFYTEGDKTCIEIIREKLQYYNDTVRQKARIEEAKTIQAEAVAVLGKYQNQYIPEGQFDSKFRENFKDNLTKKLNDYAEKTADEYTGIQADTAKSVIEAGAKALEAEKNNINTEDPAWQKVRASELWDCDYSALPFDYYYRSLKQPRLKLVFENAIKDARIPNLGVFSDNCTSILSVIQNCILNAMEVDADGVYYKELHKAVGEYLLTLDDETIKKANETKFDYGIYVNELFTLLITLPFHSPERWDYYNLPANRKIFTTLDQAYTDAFNQNKNENHQALIAQMLFHKTREEIAVPYKNEFLDTIKENFADDPDDSKEIIERIAVKKLDLAGDISFREGELHEFLVSFEKGDENQPPRSFTCMHYKREMNYGIDESEDKLDHPSETRKLSKTGQDVLNEFTADLDVLIDALRNALPYCLLMEKETESTVKDLCTRISKYYKKGLCDWIEQNPVIRQWILESKSSVSVARNRALKQVNEIYKDILNWKSETTPASYAPMMKAEAPVADVENN